MTKITWIQIFATVFQLLTSTAGTGMPVGIESQAIADDKMTSSSYKDANYTAKFGRLNGPKAWCPNVTDADPYLQIDLCQNYVICGVEVQGQPGASVFTAFRLNSSTDGLSFAYVQSAQVFNGSAANGNTADNHTLSSNITARYIRFKPVSSSTCMRVEIRGKPGVSLIQRGRSFLLKLLNKVKDVVVDWIKTVEDIRDDTKKAYEKCGCANVDTKSSSYNNSTQALNITFNITIYRILKNVTIQQVFKEALQAGLIRGLTPENTSFVFPGETNATTTIITASPTATANMENQSTTATESGASVTPSATDGGGSSVTPSATGGGGSSVTPSATDGGGVSTTAAQTSPPSSSVVENKIASTGMPVGIRNESQAIADDKMTSSSYKDANYLAKYGRLNGAKAWCPNVTDANPYLQIDLCQNYVICAVKVQGKPGASVFTAFTLCYSTDGSSFAKVQSGQVFNGSAANGDTADNHTLSPKITARYIRFKPVNTSICLRVEVYGTPETNASPTATVTKSGASVTPTSSSVVAKVKVQANIIANVDCSGDNLNTYSKTIPEDLKTVLKGKGVLASVKTAKITCNSPLKGTFNMSIYSSPTGIIIQQVLVEGLKAGNIRGLTSENTDITTVFDDVTITHKPKSGECKKCCDSGGGPIDVESVCTPTEKCQGFQVTESKSDQFCYGKIHYAKYCKAECEKDFGIQNSPSFAVIILLAVTALIKTIMVY